MLDSIGPACTVTAEATPAAVSVRTTEAWVAPTYTAYDCPALSPVNVTGLALAGFLVIGWVPFVQTVTGWPPWPMTVIEFGLVVRIWTEVLTSADWMAVRTPLAVGVAALAAGARAAPAVPMMTVAAARMPAIVDLFMTPVCDVRPKPKPAIRVTYPTIPSEPSDPDSGPDARTFGERAPEAWLSHAHAHDTMPICRRRCRYGRSRTRPTASWPSGPLRRR